MQTPHHLPPPPPPPPPSQGLHGGSAGLVAEQLVPTTYTTSLDQCLHELEAAAEYETDQLAVQLVRFQHFTENIVRFHSREQAVEEPTGQPAAWVALQKELGRLWSQVPRDLQTNRKILSINLQTDGLSLTLGMQSQTCCYASTTALTYGFLGPF